MDNQEKISNITKQSERTKKDSKKIIIFFILFFLCISYAISFLFGIIDRVNISFFVQLCNNILWGSAIEM